MKEVLIIGFDIESINDKMIFLTKKVFLGVKKNFKILRINTACKSKLKTFWCQFLKISFAVPVAISVETCRDPLQNEYDFHD